MSTFLAPILAAAEPPGRADVDDPTPSDPVPPPPTSLRWRTGLEVLGLWAAGLVILLAGGRFAVLGGLAADVASTATAAFFLLVPVLLVRRAGLDPAASLGLHARGLGRSLATFLVVAAIVFPPYILAFEGWSRLVEGRHLHLPAEPLADFPADVRGRPDLPDLAPAAVAWTQEDALYVLNASDAPVQAIIRGCMGPASGLAQREGRLFLRELETSPASDGAISGRLEPGAGWRCRVTDEFQATLEGPHAPWRTGEGLRSPGGDTVSASRSILWLFELLLIHLLVIALPEEVFYRGYVQSRLAPLFRRRLRLLGVDMGGHVVLASALFALSHLVAIPAPFRLAVFFPGLLFGWLRERTGSLVAPVLLHAFSNVLLALLVRFQG
jgi:hypothetical protein